MRLFVGNVPFGLTEGQLREHFASYGCTKTHLPVNKETGQPRGFAFVEVDRPSDAIRDLDGSLLGGRQIRVNEATQKTAKTEPEVTYARSDRSLWEEADREERKQSRRYVRR